MANCSLEMTSSLFFSSSLFFFCKVADPLLARFIPKTSNIFFNKKYFIKPFELFKTLYWIFQNFQWHFNLVLYLLKYFILNNGDKEKHVDPHSGQEYILRLSDNKYDKFVHYIYIFQVKSIEETQGINKNTKF